MVEIFIFIIGVLFGFMICLVYLRKKAAGILHIYKDADDGKIYLSLELSRSDSLNNKKYVTFKTQKIHTVLWNCNIFIWKEKRKWMKPENFL